MRGRKTLFKDCMFKEGERLARLGMTIEEIAVFWNVHRGTLHRWLNKYPEFCNTLKKAKEEADKNVEGSLYKRALGYEYKEQFYERRAGKEGLVLVKEVVKQIAPDVTAQIFWLKNRKPGLWKDRQDHKHSGTVAHTMSLQDFRESKEQYDESSSKD